MDDDHKSAYLSKLFEPGSESALQVKAMVAKARNLKLNPMLKWALREKAPLLVPVTDEEWPPEQRAEHAGIRIGVTIRRGPERAICHCEPGTLKQ